MRAGRGFWRNRCASTAVEFAFIAPLFLAMGFGIVTFGTTLSLFNGVQQLAAEGARASLAGLSSTERDSLARSFIARSLSSYPYIDASKLVVTTAPLQSPNAFQVSLTYDLTNSIGFRLGSLVPLPPVTVTRSAVVVLGSNP